MSPFEFELYQNPQRISQVKDFISSLITNYSFSLLKYLIELEKDYQKFSLFLYWNKYENVFWQWMVKKRLIMLKLFFI